MDRREFIVALAGASVAAPLIGNAQQPGKVWRLGYLGLTPITEPPSPERAGFLASLAERGYAPGKTLSIDYRSGDGDPTRLPLLADELVRERVDAIVVTTSNAAQAVAKATKTIPIVMLGIGDPIAAGVVSNLARPGSNVTGTSWQSIDLVGKRLGLLKELLPRASHIAYLWNPDVAIARPGYVAAQHAARQLGLSLDDLRVANAGDLERAIQSLERRRPDALYVIYDSKISTYRKIIADAAISLKLPAISGHRSFVEAGGLVSYAADLTELFRRGANYVDRVLRGARPGDLPIEQPTKFELIMNLKTAKALGLTIPQSLLLRADEVIQ